MHSQCPGLPYGLYAVIQTQDLDIEGASQKACSMSSSDAPTAGNGVGLGNKARPAYQHRLTCDVRLSSSFVRRPQGSMTGSQLSMTELNDQMEICTSR